MWEEIITTYLVPALFTIITGILTWIGTNIKSIIEEKVKSDKAKDIIYDVVKYTEQTCKGSTGTEKFEVSMQEASKWLNSKGIELSDYELKIMIESAVNTLYGKIKKESV